MKEVAPNPVHDRYRRLKNAGIALAALVLASCSGDKEAAPVNTGVAPSQTVEATATPTYTEEDQEMCGIIGLENRPLHSPECLIEP